MRMQRIISLLLVVVIIAACYVAYTFFYLPLWEENAQIRQDLEASLIRLATLQEIYRYRGALEVREKLYQERLNILNSVLPKQLDTIALAVQLEQLAKATGVQLSSYGNPSAPAQVDNNTVSSFQVNISGEYLRVMSFVNRLRTFQYVVNLETVALQIDQAGNISATLGCVIFLNAQT